MDSLQYFQEHVLPYIPDEQRQTFFAKYPQIRLSSVDGFVPVSMQPVVMLSALTGTGKSTTLDALEETEARYDLETLPARRDLANFIIIPAGQVLAGDAIVPIKNREDRFRYTKLFAERFAGGMASVYAGLYCQPPGVPLVSEGIRGATEISYGLAHYPGWYVLELSLNPITRLKRLSARADRFDQATATHDLSFLPVEYHHDVSRLLENGDISPEALTIMRAESQNYGLMPYDTPHERYQQIAVDGTSPQQVADVLVEILTKVNNDAENRSN